MAEDDDAVEATPVPVSTGGKKKLLLIVGGVVILAAIGAAVFFLTRSKTGDGVEVAEDAAQGNGPEVVEEGAGEEEELEDGEEPLGVIFPLDTLVVNLQGGRFLRIQLQLEFSGTEVPRRFFTKLVPIRDALVTFLAGMSAEDALAEDGKATIRRQVREIVNAALRKQEVKSVYITQFVVQ